MKGAIFISDRRMQYTAELLKKQGYVMDQADNIIDAEKIIGSDPSQYNFIVLPIRGAIEGKITLQNESIMIHSFLEGVKSNVPIITGFKSEYMKRLPLCVISFQNDDEFADANGALTAEGVLSMILSNTSKGLYEYTYDVLGIGHAGGNITSLLKKIGLFVRAISHHEKYGCISMDKWRSLEPSSIIINTIPMEIETIAPLKKWGKEILIIDISSMRTKQTERFLQYPNLTYIPAPPLPGLIAPESAGKLLSDFIIKIVQKAGGEETYGVTD